MKVTWLLPPILALAMSVGLYGQSKSTIFSTDHDISGLGGGCGSCHVPHQSSANGEVLLWARTFSTTTTFGTYSSPTMDSVPGEVGDAYGPSNLPSGAKMFTVLCLSCHDGLTTTSVIAATDSAAIANPTNSDGLSNDHPVNMEYPATDSGLHPAATVTASALKLFSDGSFTDTVQCASCHNVHDDTLGKFLRVANTNVSTGLCTTCHL